MSARGNSLRPFRQSGPVSPSGKMDAVTNVRCTTIGDRNVGKSSILSTFTDDVLCNERLIDTDSAFVMVDGKPIRIKFADTFDHVDHKDNGKKKHLSYLSTDVILICFSLGNLTSFKNVRAKWYPLVQHQYPKTPIILVGTKFDLRHNTSNPITYQQGTSMAKKIKAVKYLECSALIRQGIQVVIEEAIRAALISSEKNKNSKFCKIT